VSPAKTSEVIETPFALSTQVGPGKDLLHIVGHFGRILYCVYSTQYSHLVVFNFARYCPIFTVVLPADSAVNL